MPSIWYENHLSSPEDEVTGVSLPGVPGVVIGHNREIAWGFTAALPDTQDLYVEKRNPQNPLEFEYEGKWERARVVREEIRVKGDKTPRIVEVVITRHGPLIDQLPPLAARKSPPSEYAVSLRWSGHDVGHTHRAALKMDRSKNAEEFVAALADWSAPSMNVVWADRAGNIGYHLTGQIPIRKSGVGAAPVPGWSGEHEWTGFIPHAELPHVQNPEAHFLASANNRIAGDGYPHFLGAETMNGFRARRIVELLQQKEKLGADDFARMHVDQYCAPAKPFCELLTSLKPKILAEPALATLAAQASRAFAAVERWDYHLGPESIAGSIYQLTQHYALRRLFQPHLGDWTEPFLGVGFHPVIAPITMGYMDRSFLVGQEILAADDKTWLGETSREELLDEALAEALRFLAAQGDDWSWGRVHAAGFHHPLGAKKPLDKIFNRGPYPYGGDTNTVWQAAFVPKLPISPSGGFTASWRMIVDLADWDASRAVHTTGQSGHPASPHYDDMIWMWLRGHYHPMLWSRPRVDEHATHRLTLMRG
jgi:penicillin amidase